MNARFIHLKQEPSNMNRKIKFVQFCIWTGIILDSINVLLYLFPNMMLDSLGLADEMLTPVAIYLLFHAGIFMLGWTILLIWTLKEPIQRRFILLLTVLITVGMETSAIYLLTVESLAQAKIIPLLILPVVIGSLFIAGYIVAGSIKNDYENSIQSS